MLQRSARFAGRGFAPSLAKRGPDPSTAVQIREVENLPAPLADTVGAGEQVVSPDVILLTASGGERHQSASTVEKGTEVAQVPNLLPGEAGRSRLFTACFTVSYAISVALLIIVSSGLAAWLCRQIQQNSCLDMKLKALRMKLRADRQVDLEGAQFPFIKRSFRADVEALEDSQKATLKTIHDRGNVKLDPERREIVLKRGIAFEPMYVPSQAEARLADPSTAEKLLEDVAELLCCLPRTRILIECHTEGIAFHSVDDRAHRIADAGAELVAATLVSLGVDVGRVHAIGLPGALGSNKAQVLLRLLD